MCEPFFVQYNQLVYSFTKKFNFSTKWYFTISRLKLSFFVFITLN